MRAPALIFSLRPYESSCSTIRAYKNKVSVYQNRGRSRSGISLNAYSRSGRHQHSFSRPGRHQHSHSRSGGHQRSYSRLLRTAPQFVNTQKQNFGLSKSEQEVRRLAGLEGGTRRSKDLRIWASQARIPDWEIRGRAEIVDLKI